MIRQSVLDSNKGATVHSHLKSNPRGPFKDRSPGDDNGIMRVE